MKCDEHCLNFCRLLGDLRNIEEIASGSGVRIRQLLTQRYGSGRWRKLKGIGRIETFAGEIRLAEVHWYEAHGIGRRMIKRKFFLD